MNLLSVFISLFLFGAGVAFSIFPLRVITIMYQALEFFCLDDEDCKRFVKSRYTPLDSDPKEFAKRYPVTMWVYRVIGVVFLFLSFDLLFSV